MNMIRSKDDIPIIIVGAGNTGEKILREINDNPRAEVLCGGICG